MTEVTSDVGVPSTYPVEFNVIDATSTGDGIFRLWKSIPCLLMHWLLNSPERQQVCCCQDGIGNM